MASACATNFSGRLYVRSSTSFTATVAVICGICGITGGLFGQRSLATQPPTAQATASTMVPITAPIAPPLPFFSLFSSMVCSS